MNNTELAQKSGKIHAFYVSTQGVHNKLLTKYGVRNRKDMKDAQQIEDFLNFMRRYARRDNKKENNICTPLEIKMGEEMGNELTGIMRITTNLFTIGGVPGSEAGVIFEKEVGRLFQGVMQLANKEMNQAIPTAFRNLDWNGTSNAIWTGGAQGTTTNTNVLDKINADIASGKLSKEMIKQVKQIIGDLTKKQLKTEIDQANMTADDLYMTQVSVKPDIDTSKWQASLSIKPGSKWTKIYNAIAGHSYSLKSYKKDDTAAHAHDLKLGNSNPFRAYYGTLSSINYQPSAIISSFYHAYNDYVKEKCEIGHHMYHIRFIYELTGAGTSYSKSTGLANADMFIYNERGTNGRIYVKSTNEILYDLIFGKHNNTKTFGNPFGSIKISKSYFH